MSRHRKTDIFKYNLICLKIFGVWSGRKQSKYYKYYSFLYLFITLFTYNMLLTLNLALTPRTIELMIREVIFYFTEIAVTSKVLMMIIMKDEIIEAFDMLDSEILDGVDEKSKRMIDKNYETYQMYWKFYAGFSNFAYSFNIFTAILMHFIMKSGLDLPICKYYFLSEESRDHYFVFWFIYQSFGMYGHMMYNVNIDSFIAGLLMTAINQCRVMKSMLFDVKCNYNENNLNTEDKEKYLMARLKICLKRYNCFLRYCETVQKIINVTMFIQFGISTMIICVTMCGLLLPSTIDMKVFLLMYLFAMTMQIFLPGYLGTQLNYESTELVFAAYNTEWIPRSESFKRSIRIFVERANIPIQMSGLNMFPLSLTTFTSIMKSAYSIFTLIRTFQE